MSFLSPEEITSLRAVGFAGSNAVSQNVLKNDFERQVIIRDLKGMDISDQEDPEDPTHVATTAPSDPGNQKKLRQVCAMIKGGHGALFSKSISSAITDLFADHSEDPDDEVKHIVPLITCLLQVVKNDGWEISNRDRIEIFVKAAINDHLKEQIPGWLELGLLENMDSTNAAKGMVRLLLFDGHDSLKIIAPYIDPKKLDPTFMAWLWGHDVCMNEDSGLCPLNYDWEFLDSHGFHLSAGSSGLEDSDLTKFARDLGEQKRINTDDILADFIWWMKYADSQDEERDAAKKILLSQPYYQTAEGKENIARLLFHK